MSWGNAAGGAARETGEAVANAGGLANSGVIHGPVTVNFQTRPRRSVVLLIAGALVLGANAVGIVRWPQATLTWLTIIAGLAAVLLGVPLAWIWSARRGTGWLAEVLFAAAMAMSLLGAAFVGGGTVEALQHGANARPDGANQNPGADGDEVIPPIDEPRVRRSETITLTVTHQIDLDSMDPDWGVVAVELSSDAPIETDLSVELGRISAVNGAKFARSTSVSYSACRGATAFGGSIEADDETAATAMACLRTGQNRVAAVQVKDVSRQFGFFREVQLFVTVW